MKLPHFFIDRPIFASVLAIVITLVGGIAYFGLPVAQFPEIAPPTIVVTTSYPGASAQVVSETVATPLEQEINGVEKMLYMVSQSTGDGALQRQEYLGHTARLSNSGVGSRPPSGSKFQKPPRRLSDG